MDQLTELTEPRLAQKRLRAFAALIDALLFWVLVMIVGMAFGEASFSGNGFQVSLTGAPALAAFGGWIFLVPVQEGLTGMTAGKRIFKIKVIKTNFSPSGLGESLIRHFFDVIDFFLLGLVALLVASNNPRRQRIGDLVAGTIVVMK